MKKLLTIALFLISSVAIAQSYMLLPIVEVYDGDTIKTDLSWRLPDPLNKVSIRIYGIDTPELPAASYATTGKLNRAKCVKEAELALKAKSRVQELVGSNTRMKVTNFTWGRNGARIVGNVSVGGTDIGKTLINEGLAVEYYGSGTKQDWCQ
jgi:endonuclease YncB( thermonuclease family)